METNRRSKAHSKLAKSWLPASVLTSNRRKTDTSAPPVFRPFKPHHYVRGRGEAASVGSNDFRIDRQASNRASAQGHSRILQSCFSGSQKIGQAPTGNRSIKTKCVSFQTDFQDGYSRSDPGSNRTTDVGSFSGSDRRLSTCSDAPSSSQLSHVSDRRRDIPLPGASVRTIDSPLCIFRDHEILEALGARDGYAAVPVSRRLAATQSGSRISDVTHGPISSGLPPPGFASQLQQIGIDSYARHPVSGRPVRLSFGCDSPHDGSIRKDLSQDWPNDNVIFDDSQEMSFVNGLTSRNRENCSARQVELSHFSARGDPCSLTELAGSAPCRAVKQRTSVASLVDLTIECLARCFDVACPSHERDPDRCLHIWLGLFLSGQGLERRMVSSGFSSSYQFVGDVGRFACLSNTVLSFCRSRSDIPYRQLLCCSLSEETGWNKISTISRADSPGSSVRFRSRFHDSSLTYRGSIERDRRLSVPFRFHRQYGMAHVGSGVSLDPVAIPVGQGDNRSLCKPVESSTSAVLLSVSGHGGHGDQRDVETLAGSDTVRFSANYFDGTSVTKDPSGTTQTLVASCSQTAGSSVVSAISAPASTSTDPDSFTGASAATATLALPASQPSPIQFVSVVHSLPFLKAKGYSDQAILRMQKVHTDSTNKMYLSQWKLFESWCVKKSLNPIQATAVAVADFFIHLFDVRKVQPQTIESYKSALTFILNRVSGYDLSKCTVLLDMIRSFKLERPRVVKTVVQWDLSIVLKFLASERFRDGKVSNKDLTTKSVFLVALAAGKRRGEIHALERSSVMFAPNMDGVTLKPHPGFLSKTHIVSHGTGTFSEICLPSLKEADSQSGFSRLCPVHTLCSYVKCSDEYRTVKQTRLFISPMRAKLSDISAQTISTYIKKAIIESYQDIGSLTDIELKQFNVKAHQVRHVAHSMAQLKNISVQEIIKTGGWTSSDTFISSYLQNMSSSAIDNLSEVGAFVAIEQVFQPTLRSPYSFRDRGKGRGRGNARRNYKKK